MPSKRTISTIAAIVLVIFALWRTVQWAEYLLLSLNAHHIGQLNGLPPVAATIDVQGIIGELLVVFAWWSVAALAGLIRIEIIERSSSPTNRLSTFSSEPETEKSGEVWPAPPTVPKA